jgi:hypothetical protein
MLSEMHKLAKRAQTDPNFSSTLQLLPVPHMPNFTRIQYSRHLLHNLFIFFVILFEPSAKIIFPQPKFKPSTHFTYSHTYLPISELSAHFPIISCPVSNFKLSMTQFTVQTSFSRRLTSVFPNLSVFMP